METINYYQGTKRALQALEHKIVKTLLYIDNQFWLHVITVINVYSCNSLLYYHLKLMHVVSSQYRHIRHRPPPQHQILKNIFLIIILFKLPSKVLEKSTVICERQEVFMRGWWMFRDFLKSLFLLAITCEKLCLLA